MTHSQITQCPHCQTRFRISDAQLRAAYGSVRCGACFKVFTAIQDTASSVSAHPAASTTSAGAAHASDDTLWIHDDLDLDSLDQALERLEREQQSLMAPSLELNVAPDAPITPSRIEPEFVEPEPLHEQALQAEPLYAEPPSAAEGPSPTPNKLAFSVDDEPLQLPAAAAPKRRSRWLVLGVLALIGLSAQYIYYNFDTLARQPSTRPALETLCAWAGCSVPARVDISQLRSSNLSVREHGQFPGALMVDAIIYNRASYPQPFPLLEMRFSDINGEVLAKREFRPSEYLAGELAGQGQMPPQTPIRIALEVLDPGQNAVGYSLEFHSP